MSRMDRGATSAQAPSPLPMLLLPRLVCLVAGCAGFAAAPARSGGAGLAAAPARSGGAWVQELLDAADDPVLLVDGNNVRGFTGFRWAPPRLLAVTAAWAAARGLEHRVVVVLDHGVRASLSSP